MTHTLFAKAEEFIWKNARQLERKLFAFHFKGGAHGDALTALLAYQNDDGGFGNALEPDIRCPQSQPVATQHGLEFLDEIGFDPEIAQRACDYLTLITTDDGGVPWLMPSALDYPRAWWWQTEPNPPASLNPTAAIVGVLCKNEFAHPWVEKATEFCWSKLEQFEQTESIDTMGTVLQFLFHAPDRTRAEQTLSRLVGPLFEGNLVADVHADGYVRKPLEWAPTPDHPLRPYFSNNVIEAHLDAVIQEQADDGGWSITWEAVSPACELEWRGWITLRRLLMLRSNGRLTV